MLPALRVLFRSVRHLAEIEPELMRPVRFHFVGTNYATGNMVRELVMPLARELAVERFVDEHPGRVPYLEALQILLDSAALLVLGSTSSHYSASKLFPYILANRPLLPIFHEASSVVQILAGDAGGSRNRIWRCRLFRQGAAGGGKPPEGTPQVSAGCTSGNGLEGIRALHLPVCMCGVGGGL